VIPSTGLLALILLAGVVFWLARKHPGFGTSVAVLLLLGAGVVWAANFIVDGQVADWTGVSPLSADAGNDASSGEPQIELVQVFAATEAGRLFARADLSDTQSAAPVFNSAATATFTTGSPGTFSVTAAGIPDADPEPERRNAADRGRLQRCHRGPERHADGRHGRKLSAAVQRHQLAGHDDAEFQPGREPGAGRHQRHRNHLHRRRARQFHGNRQRLPGADFRPDRHPAKRNHARSRQRRAERHGIVPAAAAAIP
jgi:hypothetical protein